MSETSNPFLGEMKQKKGSHIWKKIKPYLVDHSFKIEGAGIRYGPVAYIGFGPVTTQDHHPRPPTQRHSIELEIGSDEWMIKERNTPVLRSNFGDKYQAHLEIRRRLISKQVLGFEIHLDRAILFCSATHQLKCAS